MKYFTYIRHTIISAIVLIVAFVLVYGLHLVLQGSDKVKILLFNKAKADVPVSPPPPK